MSFRITDLAWKVKLSKATEKIVLLCLADFANKTTGLAWPSVQTIADRTELSGRAVQKAVKALVLAGHLSRIDRPGRSAQYIVHPRTTCGPTTELRSPLNDDLQPPNEIHSTPERSSAKPIITSNNQRAEDAQASAIRQALEEDDYAFSLIARRCHLQIDGVVLLIHGLPFAISRLQNDFGNKLLAQAREKLGSTAKLEWRPMAPPNKRS